eukprot:ctg_1121.g575
MDTARSIVVVVLLSPGERHQDVVDVCGGGAPGAASPPLQRRRDRGGAERAGGIAASQTGRHAVEQVAVRGRAYAAGPFVAAHTRQDGVRAGGGGQLAEQHGGDLLPGYDRGETGRATEREARTIGHHRRQHLRRIRPSPHLPADRAAAAAARTAAAGVCGSGAERRGGAEAGASGDRRQTPDTHRGGAGVGDQEAHVRATAAGYAARCVGGQTATEQRPRKRRRGERRRATPLRVPAMRLHHIPGGRTGVE